MSHLILPIDIDGTKYCVKHGASSPKWRTISFLADGMVLTAAEDDDEWEIPDEYSIAVGKITFGTCCLWKATVRYHIPSDEFEWGYAGSVWINGVEIDSFSRFTDTAEVVDIVIDLNALGLMGRPCGNIWDIFATLEDTGTLGMRIEIVNVTFGPPV